MISPLNASAGRIVAAQLGATDPNAWVAFGTQAQWENGGSPRSNNPFNLTDPGRAMAWRAYGQTGWYSGGSAPEPHDDFAAFATLTGGARAAAANYQHQGSYGKVLAACLAGDGPVAIAGAIESSPWSTDHYGGELSGRVSAELAALFAATAAHKIPPQEAPAMDHVTTFAQIRDGTTPAGTRRFAAEPPHDELPLLTGDGNFAFAAEVLIDGPDTPHGTFWLTATTPPFLVAKSAVTAAEEPAAVLPDPAPVVELAPPAPGKIPPSNTAAASSAAIAALVAAGYAQERTNPSGGLYYYIDPATVPSWAPELNRLVGATGMVGNPAAPAAGVDYSDFTGVTGTTGPEGLTYDVWIRGVLVHSEPGSGTTDTVALGEAWGVSYLGGGQ